MIPFLPPLVFLCIIPHHQSSIRASTGARKALNWCARPASSSSRPWPNSRFSAHLNTLPLCVVGSDLFCDCCNGGGGGGQKERSSIIAIKSNRRIDVPSNKKPPSLFLAHIFSLLTFFRGLFVARSLALYCLFLWWRWFCPRCGGVSASAVSFSRAQIPPPLAKLLSLDGSTRRNPW